MLSTIKKFQKYNKPFYGMNRGTFGFLMNKFKVNEIMKNLEKAKIINISPLDMTLHAIKEKRRAAVIRSDQIRMAIMSL